MNANELADWIENGAPFGKYETAKQAVVMLRQQQAEIEALKAGKIRAYDNGYEDGRKPDTNPKLAKTEDEEIVKLMIPRMKQILEILFNEGWLDDYR